MASRFGRCALSGVAACLLAACGGSQPPIGAAGAMPQSIATRLQARNTGTKYRVLFDFGSNVFGLYGAFPVAPLIDVNGTLYGTTEYGGSYYFRSLPGAGTVFSIGTSGLNERVLLSFEAYEGGPVAGLVAVNGMLYGTTVGGGKFNAGMVFSVGTNGKNARVLHSFGKGADGVDPRASLTALHGVLYGTTYQGGSYGAGTVFSVRISDGRERVLHSFSGQPDCAYPLSNLIDVHGLLYGTAPGDCGNGGGGIFSISTTGVEKIVFSFGPSTKDGSAPEAGVIAKNGWFYGTTEAGGSADYGTVFKVRETGTDEQVLHSFTNNGSDGIGPTAGVIDVKEVLYGTTSAGGSGTSGTVFRVTTDGKNERVLHSFTYGENDGLLPEAGLIDVDGTLYGTTAAGGISLPSCPRSASQSCDYGTVFALAP
ncbi:MAG TPA: choice-of-anchor tandem repeat GloVer-containing protein [Candidatus Binatia bacterium]|nr:choice-of-anchor tandem repeat GloVer-containing protein [Candidatus Binatia bacterium]